MKDKFQSKAVPRGTRTIWRYLSALILLFYLSIGQMWAAVYATYSVSDLTYTAATLTYEKTGLSGNDQKLNKGERKVEVPCASASGTLYLSGTGANSGRYASIWGTNGTAVDATRKVSMTSGYGDGIAFSSSDILTDGDKYYIVFGNVDGADFKINAFKYVLSEACSSSPVDPTITFNDGAYTVGGSALDLSTLFTSNSSGAVTYSVKDADETGADIDGTSFTASAAGTAVVTASQAAVTGTYNAKTVDANIVVSPAVTPACPSGLSVSGTAAYTEGETISLTAALSEGNGEITYNWYKGADLATAKAAGSIGTGTSFSKVSCATSDAGNYFCVASKDGCLTDAESTAYAVTVEEKTCPTSGELYSMTMKSKSLSGVTQNTEVALAGDYATEEGGVSYIGNKNSDAGKAQIKTDGGGTVYFNGNDAYVKIVLDCPLKADDKITFVPGSGTRQVCFTTTNTRTDTYQTSSNTFTVSSAFLATAADPENVTTLYVWRIGSSTYLHSLTITRPYEITFANGGHGTVPSATKGFEVTLEQITGVEGFVHTGWTADKAVKVGNEDKAAETTLAVDAEVTVSSDVTFTAVWEEEIAAVDPVQTFDNGTYTIGGAALDLSTLFTSNNTVGTVTYSVKTAGETGATIDGVNFTATAAGEAVVTASQAASNGFNAKSIEATITVSAPVEVDGIKMVEAGALTGNFRTSQSLTTLSGDSKYTIAGLDYTKYIKFGSSVSSWSAVAGPSNKYLAFTPTKEKTNFYFYVHNNANSASYINLYLVEEGNTTPSKVQVAVAANENALKEYELNITKNTEVYITAESNNVYFCQVVAVESGNALKQAPEVGYVMNLNKGRLSTASGVATTLEGLTFCLGSGYSIAGGSNISIGTKGTHYVSFTIPEGQTRQLQVTTSNTAKYTVSKTLGDDENQITPVSGTAKNFNLTAGTWYINPQGSNVNITNIAFAATPTPLTVTFKDGENTLGTQTLFSGDKAAALDPAPTKTGYRFVKWQKEGVDYDFDTEVTTDIILNAVWQEVVTVTFNPENGEDSFTKQADKGAVLAVEDRPVPEWAGHVFQGWTRDASAEPIVYVNLASETFSIAATLTAVWEVAQTDATISALSYNGNAIDVESAKDVDGVATYTVHLQWGSTIDASLISVTKTASTATVGDITYDSEAKKATFTVTAGDGITTADYAIQFVIDAKRGTSLIKATTNNVVTGLIGGTIDQSYSGNADARKLNANNYFGVTLANDETFQEGDVFIINITTAADLGKFMVYADAARTELIANQGITYTKPTDPSPVVCPTGEMRLVLPAAVAGKKSLYLSRENSATAQWNPTFSYVEVTREMAPAIKSFKIGEAEGTINESTKTISIEVPYGTALTGLTPTVEAYGNNGATYTPAGVTDFTSPVVYTVTDGYNEFHTDYTVTVTIAAPSENADLASLAIAGYSIDFDPATTSYNVILDYGTTVLPEITYAVEDAGLATAVKVEGGVNGATTITVTPQAGAGYEKVYTINFSVSTTPKFVIYDGSTMTEIATSGSDVSTGFAWTMVGGKTDGAKSISVTLNGKTYTTAQNVFGSPTTSDTRYIEITIPEGYLAKFYLAGATNNNGETRSSYISKEKTGTLDQSIAYASTDSYAGAAMRSALQLPGTYYYCADKSIRLYELSVQLYSIDYSRDVTEGRYGTICLPNGGLIAGATLYEVAYYGATSQKIFFDEILGGVMEAGTPYIFLPETGATQLAVLYTDEVNADAKRVNGLVGSYTEEVLTDYENDYVLYNNQYLRVVDNGAVVKVGANRAYIRLDEIGRTEPALVPGRRRIAMGVQNSQVATGMENLNAGEAPMKVVINGQLFILRGENMFDATGRLVK